MKNVTEEGRTMEFKVLTEEEFRDFIKDNPKVSFMQAPELAHLKKELGSGIHYLGVTDGDKIVAASLVLEDSTILNKKMFYAPRGLIVDYHDKELLKFFTDELKKYIKKHNGFILTIDPNVIYRVRTREGEIDPDNPADDETINNLKELGYKHYGFNLYLETKQARWCYLLELDKDYEELKRAFSKRTRKNIDFCTKRGLKVREGTIDDLSVMTEIFEITSKRNDFFSRSLEYYQKMYHHMKDLMTIYIAYLDPDVYCSHAQSMLDGAKKNLEDILAKMEKLEVGSRLVYQKEEAERLVGKYEKELEEAKKFKEENPDGKDIGCMLSLRSGDEYLTLSSGFLREYKLFTPKYLMYDHHIREAYKEGFRYCNFYGITGDFNPESQYYGIYEFKKGFNGKVIEYIGEFEIAAGPFYHVYKALKKIKSKL